MNPWKGILMVASFYIPIAFHMTNLKSPGILLFGSDMVVPIEHIANCVLKSNVNRYQ